MAGNPETLTNAAGVVVFEGTTSESGGPQPGISVVDYLFTEVATAGVYTAPTLALPENSYLIDVQWFLTGNGDDWAANTALLDVIDTVEPGISGQDVKNSSGVASAAQIIDLAQPYIYPNISGSFESASATITTKITTTIAMPPVVPKAVMIVRLFYTTAPTPAAAVFA